MRRPKLRPGTRQEARDLAYRVLRDMQAMDRRAPGDSAWPVNWGSGGWLVAARLGTVVYHVHDYAEWTRAITEHRSKHAF